MTHINRTALLPYPSHTIFALVNDIEAYPQYMEGCVGAAILKSEQDTIEARLDLAKGGVRQSFSTRNFLDAPKAIRMELIDGPFDQFEGRWYFQNLNDEACKVILELEFSLASRVMGLAVGKLFTSVSDNLVDALCKRAHELYGR